MIREALGAAGFAAVLSGFGAPAIAAADGNDGPTQDGTSTSTNAPGLSQSGGLVSGGSIGGGGTVTVVNPQLDNAQSVDRNAVALPSDMKPEKSPTR